MGQDGLVGWFCQVEVGQLLFSFLNRLAQQVRLGSSVAEQAFQDARPSDLFRLPGSVLSCELTLAMF